MSISNNKQAMAKRPLAQRSVKVGPISNAVIILSYVAAIAVVEAAGIVAGAVAGTLCAAVLFSTLLNHYVLARDAPYARLLPVLALFPLLRILSLVMPIKEVPQIYWFVLVGMPLLLAAVMAARLLGLSGSDLGLRLRSWPTQVVIALSGVPLSIVAFLILLPRPLIPALDWRNVAIGFIILLISTGFVEEVIFRGMLQAVAAETLGRAGIIFSSALFMLVYLGSLSLQYILFIWIVGIFFGWCVARTKSIWGVVVAHGLLNAGMLLIWPLAGITQSHEAILQARVMVLTGIWPLHKGLSPAP